jgi:signal transduction histidine kinase
MSRDMSTDATPTLSGSPPRTAANTSVKGTRTRRVSQPTTRWIVAARVWRRRILHKFDAALVPDPAVPGHDSTIDYRRVVLLIAAPALLIFLPSLPIAGVPSNLWVTFVVLAFGAAVTISTSLLLVPRGSFVTLLTPLTNGAAIALVGIEFRPYYHALDLLYPLLVTGHAILHGIGPAFVAVGVGTVVVTFAIHDPTMANWSEIGYTALYLTGAALLPWTAWRLAQRRAALLVRSQRESESRRARLEAVLRSMDDAVMVVDREGGTVISNAALDKIVAANGGILEPLDERGHRIRRNRRPQSRAAAGEAFETSFMLQLQSGERRWYEAQGGPIGSTRGFSGGVVVIRDITDRSLRRQQEQFMATASHELRTPIAALHGYVQLLARRLDPQVQPREAEYARIALSQTRRIGHLLDRLFDLARLQLGRLEVEREPVDLIALVRSVIASTASLAGDRELRLEAVAPSLIVEADALRLEQVLQNVLTNAIDHAPDSKRIDVGVSLADRHALVTVRDYGPGIPGRRLSRIFSGRAASGGGGRQQGLGLGLFISRELLQAQRGSIEISSEPGKGTAVTIRVPLIEGAADGGDHARP